MASWGACASPEGSLTFTGPCVLRQSLTLPLSAHVSLLHAPPPQNTVLSFLPPSPLQRVYGTAWESAEQLAAYNHLKAEAARRDHRKLGQELGLFSIQEEAGGHSFV